LTALSQYARLECPGVWRADPEAQRQEVVVAFGAFSMMNVNVDVKDEMRRIQQEERKTVIFVTHDVEEAAFLADRIIVFTRRPARVLAVVDVTARLGLSRPLELREEETFFTLRNELLHYVRSTASDEEAAP